MDLSHKTYKNESTKASRCGYVTLIGRPNVGKSTLLNQLIGLSLSIVCHKPQTTRHRILAIKTDREAQPHPVQAIYLDTPGLHRQTQRSLNRRMNRQARMALSEAKVIVLVVEAGIWLEQDQWVLEQLETIKISAPVILVANKVDRVTDKKKLLPYLQMLRDKKEFDRVIPLSARSAKQVQRLESEIYPLLPHSDFLFPEDQLTDRSDRFLASEIIRGKLMQALHQELPYALAVKIESFQERKQCTHISAALWVENSGQKAIVIGKNGEKLKIVGTLARKAMERLFGQKVFLQLWVRVHTGWPDDHRALSEQGL